MVRALLAYKRGEPRVCAMVKAPTPEEEDRRRLCRERKVLIGERVRHVNRVKGLLFSQGISFSAVIYCVPSSMTFIASPANSTRNVCHCLATGASTYLMVTRRPFCV